jgi:hypothetical protein
MLPGRVGLPPTQFGGPGARFSERSRQRKTATKPPGFGSQNCSTQAYCNIKNTLKTNNKAKGHCRKSLSDSPRCAAPAVQNFRNLCTTEQGSLLRNVDTSSWAAEAEDEVSIIASHSRSMSSSFASVVYADRKLMPMSGRSISAKVLICLGVT